MKDLRLFQIVLLGAFALLAIIGLVTFATFSGFGNGPRVGEVTVWGTLPKAAVEAGLAELVAEDSGYGDVSYVEKAEATWRRELADAIAEGAGPDLIILSQEELYAEASKLQIIPYATLSERAFIDSYVPIFEQFLDAEGFYGVPLVVDPLMLFYNRPQLASAGVAQAPRTWEAVAGLAPRLSVRDGAGGLVRSAIPFGEYTNVRNARAVLSLLFLQAGTPISASATQGLRSVLADQSDRSFGVTPAESALSFYTQFADPGKTTYSWNRAFPESRQLFVAGDLAFYPGFASELGFIMAANPNLDFDIAALPSPGTSAARVSYARAYALAIPRASGNPAGASAVAFALAGQKPSAAVARALSAAPALRALLSAPGNDRYAAVYYPEALTAKGWRSPAPVDTDAAFSLMVGNVVSGRQSVPGALQAASDALDAAFRR